jgi:small subunit ribosomal protein S6
MVTKEVKAEDVLQDDYEVVFIINPSIGDDSLDPVIDSISQLITNRGGVVGEVARWGRKKLAYPIKHALEGNYVLMRYKLNPASNKELESNLRISEKIIRFLVIKPE